MENDVRLDKYLANSGFGSRSEVKELVRKGRVRINGSPVKDAGADVKDADSVEVDNKPTKGMAELGKPHWYMLNKPAGIVSANTDERDRTVIDLFEKEGNRKLFTVGRLDKDTEGLLLVSDDGELGHYLLSPSRHVEKTYLAKVKGTLAPDAVERTARGIAFKDFTSKPAKMEIKGTGQDGLSEVLITLTEGKYHEVKRIVAAVGGEVVYLKRLSFGPLMLDEGLKPGEYRALTDNETELLKLAVEKERNNV